MINDKNKIPGCETFTRPEEIQALSKYLGHIKEVQEEHVGLDESTLIVPGKDTGKFPKIDSLPNDVEKLSVSEENIKLVNFIDPIPNQGNEDKRELSNVIVGLDNVGEFNTDIKKYGETENLEVDEKIDKLSDFIDPITGEIKNNKLSDTIIGLEDKRNIEPGDVVVELEDNRKTKLSDTVINLKDSRTPELENTVINLEDSRTSELENTVIGLEDTRNPKLENTIIGLEDTRNIELDDTRLELQDTRNPKLENTVIGLEDKRNIELDETKLELQDNRETKLDETKLTLEDIRETKLPDTVLNLEDTRENKLDETKLELQDDRETKLPDTVLNLEDDREIELPETRLELQDSRDIELPDTKLDLVDSRTPELDETVIGLQDDRIPELSETRLDIEDTREPSLLDTVLNLEDTRENNLEDTIINLAINQNQKPEELSETRLDLVDDRTPELSETRLDIEDTREPSISDTVLNLEDTRENNLEDTIINLAINQKPEKLSETRLDLVDDREIELGETRLDIEDTRNIELSDTKLNLEGTFDVELPETRLDLIDGREPILTETILGLQEEPKELDNLEEKVLDLNEKPVEVSGLEEKVLGLEEKPEDIKGLEEKILSPEKKPVEVSGLEEKVLGLEEKPKELNDLEEKVLDLDKKPEEIKELEEKVLSLEEKPEELEELSEKILSPEEKPEELNDLGEKVLDLDKKPEELNGLYEKVLSPEKNPEELNGLEEKVLSPEKKPEELNGLEEKVLSPEKKPEELNGLEDTLIKRANNENPNGEVESLYDSYIELAENLTKIEDEDELFNRVIGLIWDSKYTAKNGGEWEKKMAALVSSYLSSEYITEARANEFRSKLINYCYIPDYNRSMSMSLGNISSNIRYLAEQTAKIGGHGSSRKKLLDETIWALILGRDLAEELTHVSRSSLPGYTGSALTELARGKSVGEIAGGAVKSTIKTGMSSLMGEEVHESPINYPTNNTKGWEYGNNRNSGGTEGGTFRNVLKSMLNNIKSMAISSLSNSKPYQFKANYLTGTGIQTTLKDLCYEENIGTVEELFDVLKSSPFITTPTKFGTIEKGLYKAQTLDSNAYWEVILEPYCNTSMNGGFSYLPAIQEINEENIRVHGVNTGYNRWIPINSFELQKSKVTTKSLGLYEGEISYPISIEFTNEVRITIVDDQYKSWKRYFETCAMTGVYNSTPHDSNYYIEADANFLRESPSPTAKTVIDKTNICVALYKNIAFRCRIYIMTPQYSTIRKYDLLLVMKDFTEEYNGDVDASPTDLTVAFSIVGENPPEANNSSSAEAFSKFASKKDNSVLLKNKQKNNITSKATKALSLL